MAAKQFTASSEQTKELPPASDTVQTSDKAMLSLLRRIKETNDPDEIRQLSDQLERVIFHKQFENAL